MASSRPSRVRRPGEPVESSSRGQGGLTPTAWLALVRGHDVQGASSSRYEDVTGESYLWDETVHQHAKVAAGDLVVVWDGDTLIGVSRIDHIEQKTDVAKTIFKCPGCQRASFKRRHASTPIYRCFRPGCHLEFDQPSREVRTVRAYKSHHGRLWTDLPGVLTGEELRESCYQPRSQHSLRRLDWSRFVQLLEGRGYGGVPDLFSGGGAGRESGHRCTTVRVRRGQAAFRRRLLDAHGGACAITGPCPLAVLEACHLYSYAETGVHLEHGGLLLRRDLHALFDLGLIAFEPPDFKLRVSPALDGYDTYTVLRGRELEVPITAARREWLLAHWELHAPKYAHRGALPDQV